MKIAYSWLKQFADFDLSVDQTSKLLTDCGLEIDAIEAFESVKGGLKGLIIGEVISCEPHPDADRLRLTKVNIGQEILSIVCGAPNVAINQKVVVATIGTVLYQGKEAFQIKKSKIRGVESFGMLCAQDEIGLGSSHDGIIVLPVEAEIGKPASEYFNIASDSVFEIGLTPNRSDAVSHLGVCRDIVAALIIRNESNIKLKYPSVEHFKDMLTDPQILIKVEDVKACPRYTGISIKGIKVGESPGWLKNRLLSIGIRPINNVVDITNYVLMELGQPLHAFDQHKIKGNKLIVRMAKEKESLICLDGIKRELTSSNLVICDQEKPMCIAGVLGGANSGVNHQTTEIFLESAYFDAVNIRKTAKAHGLNTDASFRYERGADPNICIYALKRAALLICEICGGEISSPICEFYPEPILPYIVDFNVQRAEKIIGKELGADCFYKIFTALEMEVLSQTRDEASHDDILKIQVPHNKVDVQREIDLVEEALRIYGYNRIESQGRYNSFYHVRKNQRTEIIQQNISELLSSNGFNEILNNSLTKTEYLAFCSIPVEDAVELSNPLSKELNILRPSLLFGGLESIAFNLNRKQHSISFYEFGRSYKKSEHHKTASHVDEKFLEIENLGLWLCGNQKEDNWEKLSQKWDYYCLKGYCEKIFNYLKISFDKLNIVEANPNIYQYGIEYRDRNHPVLAFGLVKSSILTHFDIKHAVFFAEFNFDLLLKLIPQKNLEFKDIAKFPMVKRDLALLIDGNISFDQIESIAFETEKHLLKKVQLFDIYQGEKLPKGKKSYAVSFYLQSPEKTLTDTQIEKIMEKIQKALQENLGASLR